MSGRQLARVLWGRRRQCRALSVAAVGQLWGLAVEYYLGLFEIPPGVWQDVQVSMGIVDWVRRMGFLGQDATYPRQ